MIVDLNAKSVTGDFTVFDFSKKCSLSKHINTTDKNESADVVTGFCLSRYLLNFPGGH